MLSFKPPPQTHHQIHSFVQDGDDDHRIVARKEENVVVLAA